MKNQNVCKPLTTFLLIMLTLIWEVPVHSQLTTGKIEGTVLDQETGQPLVGAQVIVEGTRLGNVTNLDGYYFILSVPPGQRAITFSYTGYQKTTVAGQMILAGQTTTVDASLSSTLIQLEMISIQGESVVLLPRDQTVSKQRLTAEELRETPADKLEDLMILQAGVQTGGRDALARGLRIRGGRLGEEAMVVDGVTVRNYTAHPTKEWMGWWSGGLEVGTASQDATPL